MTYPLLDTLITPHDIKDMDSVQRQNLCAELRGRVIEVVSKTGGHLSSNLGIVDLTVALHACYDLKKDAVIYDVGHQVYPHKLLTGRHKNFESLKQKGGLSGYPNPQESDYDPFFTSHSSTSLSSALGLLSAAEYLGEDKRAVAVIGDGAMSAGIAFEALNNAGAQNKNLLVILNDNEMSISPSVGALSRSLARLRANPTYNDVRTELNRFFDNVPMVGNTLRHIKERFINSTHLALLPGFIFKGLGFRYFGPIDGNDTELLIDEINNLKKLDGPILLHILTKKGKGYDPAIKDPTGYHGVQPFEAYSIPTAEEKEKVSSSTSYTAVFKNALIEAASRDKRILAITAAMADGTGLADFEKAYPDRYFDVGIAEQHAVCFGAALAKGGAKPVIAIYSTFLQRAYDQLFHDVSLQGLAPVLCLDRAGLVGSDGPSQHGVNDIAYMRHLPNMVLMAPASGDELGLMLNFAIDHDQATAIRYPKDKTETGHFGKTIETIVLGKAEVLREGTDVCLIAYGAMVKEAIAAADLLNKENISVNVINARFAKPLDWQCMADAAKNCQVVFTLEDHALSGGFGSAVLEGFNDNGINQPIKRLGLPDHYIDHATRTEQLCEIGLDPDSIVKTVKASLTTATTKTP